MAEKKQHTGLKRLYRATIYSGRGLAAAWRNEAAFRQEMILVAFLLPLALLLGGSGLERSLLTGSLLLVLIVELLNSGIEAAVDRHGSEHHPLSGLAKDLGSAAVFVALLNAVLTWTLILLG